MLYKHGQFLSSKRSNRIEGGALVFVMIFIVIATLGAAYMLRTRGNQSEIAHGQHQQMVVSRAASEAMDKIKADALSSVAYFSNLRQRFSSPSDIQNFLEPIFRSQYANLSNYSSFLNNREIPGNSSSRKLKDFFVDWARKSYSRVDSCLTRNQAGDKMDCWDGFRSTKQERIIRQDGITYEFSIRCLKDDTYITPDADGNYSQENTMAYMRGDFDGCPVGLLSSDIRDVPDEMRDAITGSGLTGKLNLLVRRNWSAVTRVGNNGDPCTNEIGACAGSRTIFENWVRLPKRLEIVVTAKKGDTLATNREIAEAEPVVLNDYAYALGNIPLDPINDAAPTEFIRERDQFNLGATQIFGRFHIRQDTARPLPKVCPDWAFTPISGRTIGGNCSAPADQIHNYRVVINAKKQSMYMFRPFTYSGVEVDAIKYLAGDDSIPLQTANTSINFLGGVGSDDSLDVVSSVNRAIDTVRDSSDPSIVKFGTSLTDCRIFLSGRAPNNQNNRVHVECLGSGFNGDIDLSSRPTTLYFENGVTVVGGAIKRPIAVYSGRGASGTGSDIRFQGSAFFDTRESGQNRSFQPYLADNPDNDSIQNPLDVSSSDGEFKAIQSSGNSMAMWVSSRDIVIDAQVAKPMIKVWSDSNGAVFEESTGGSLLNQGYASGVLPMIKSNQSTGYSPNPVNRSFIIDGKIQAVGTIRTQTKPDPRADQYEGVGNLGSLLMRGGISVGEMPIARRMDPNPNSCGTNTPCAHGFNIAWGAFDNKVGYSLFPAQEPQAGVVNWQTVSSETTYGKGLFGRNDVASVQTAIDLDNFISTVSIAVDY